MTESHSIIALGREPGGNLVVIPDGFMFEHRALIILAAAQNNVPAGYFSTFARDGGCSSRRQLERPHAVGAHVAEGHRLAPP
jgi:hypothetical protein